MTPEQLAEEIAFWVDGEYADGLEANLDASAEGDSIVFRVGVVGQPTRRFRAVLVELAEPDDPSSETKALFDAGRADMLRRVLEEAETFRGLMKRRRYVNNANGVGRFVEYLRTKLAEEERS